MTDKERWTAAEVASAAEPLDDRDAAMLAGLRRFYEEQDPVPDGLVDRLKFAVALSELMTEVAELTRVPTVAAGVRSEVAVTRTHTLTFSAESLTAMVTVGHSGTSARLDGWIAPPRELAVRLRMDGRELSTRSEPTGRFVFDNVPEGFVQLVFEIGTTTVVTPLFEL
ncbi:carboxypeptidase regulatory-like domain-containing protein [Occultella glacieicola]|uniref:Carboxypeptidase regulatory-like domain-containing protein n=1 Tax=Occultella glacieicola TaxID=2518684 RepID=A0ABY2E9C8_9MICO|nr:carboxypeptidase regulatory-like domain-containing protein [Occultella glacieicola]TDE99092.1 carboxypeptidase regulatory-like domain-containing protein [Occultella glacieicola]